jgi:ATP-dependent Lon protease
MKPVEQAGRKVEMDLGHPLEATDFHVEAIDLLGNRQGCEAGVALFIAVHSALKKRPVLPGLLILVLNVT